MQTEKYGSRHSHYSAWHRAASTKRFVGDKEAKNLAIVDIDAVFYVEYEDGTREPVALIETAQDVGQSYKCADVTKRLAEKAGIAAYCCLYTLSDRPNPADNSSQDICAFRVKRLLPQESKWIKFTPAEWCRYLLNLRRKEA